MAVPAQWRAPVEDEASDLMGLADSLTERSGDASFRAFAHARIEALSRIDDAFIAERELEGFAQRLRRLWLDVSHDAANRNYRSPPADARVETATCAIENFGYERELQPAELEARCREFFEPPPHGWRVDHLLFSSGQAAMAAALHLAQKLPQRDASEPRAVAHLGAYYETVKILELFPQFRRGAAADADIVLIEPVFLDGAFHEIDAETLLRLRRNPAMIVFDDTLTGAALRPARDLTLLETLRPTLVLRIASGLKLLQGGFELANVGVTSCYAPDVGVDVVGRLRAIRALLGLGLRFSDVAALEAPWFLDRAYTESYRHAVFAHNVALAKALFERSGAFSIEHPALNCSRGHAPYCVLRLKGQSPDRYERLAARIGEAARQRGVSFERGGSFGFRGHRFDVVTPEGQQPYLRIAMGRRGGWSAELAPEIVAQAAEMT